MSETNREIDCELCNDSGEVAMRTTYPMSYAGPGPVPEYAKNVFAYPCHACAATLAKGDGKV